VSTVVRESMRFENVFDGRSAAVRAFVGRLLGVVLLAGLWVLCAAPMLTWLAASAALLHALDAGPRSPAEALRAFREGLRHHWRGTVPLGALLLLAAAVLVLNLLFLSGHGSAAAVVLAVGTVALMLIWASAQLALVPVVVLFPAAGPWRWLQAAFVVAFRNPVRSAGLVIVAGVLPAAAFEFSPLLVPLCAPVVGHLAMRACLRQVVIAPGGTPALR
jgi:uncharacterized membrane protein YesL